VKWFSAASDVQDLSRALDSCIESLRGQLAQKRPDLLMVFVTPHHLFHYGTIAPRLQGDLSPRVLLGCSAGAVIGGGCEIEQRPGLTLTAAVMPGVESRLVHVTREGLPELDGSPRPWRDLLAVDPRVSPQLVVLGDPFSLDLGHLLQGLDYAYPRAPKVGGLASGAQFPGGNALFQGGETRREGALILSLWGNVHLDTIVAQGCRPIGRPARVTRCDRNLLQEVDGMPCPAYLQELYDGLDDRDRELARTALFLGLAMDTSLEDTAGGDFLVRNVLGMNRETGYVAVGANLREGQRVQFHVRDKRTAAEDLDHHLRSYLDEGPATSPAGVLLFSCLGRGASLYGEPDHDSRRFRETVAPVAIGGFFCNGEIGPVGGITHLHGYTSAFGIFRPKAAAAAGG
jgi:small ligand-binding sensory domain FIST